MTKFLCFDYEETNGISNLKIEEQCNSNKTYCFEVQYNKKIATLKQIKPPPPQSGGLITMKSKKTKKQSGGFPRVSDMQPYKT